jgi:hypothetical protein
MWIFVVNIFSHRQFLVLKLLSWFFLSLSTGVNGQKNCCFSWWFLWWTTWKLVGIVENIQNIRQTITFIEIIVVNSQYFYWNCCK